MNYLIIIRGPAGVGKTTISRKVALIINAEVFHFEKIMRELKLDYIAGDKWIPLNKFLMADKIMLPKFKKAIKKHSIILDGNFYQREQIEDLIKKIDSPHFVFTLKADIKECVKRDKKRKGKLGEQATKDVFNLVSAFDYGISIDTNNKTPEAVVRDIISFIS
jgi:broad-specificity NMP kinase